MNSYLKLPDGGVIEKSTIISITKHEANEHLKWPSRLEIRYGTGKEFPLVSVPCYGEEREKILRDLVSQLAGDSSSHPEADDAWKKAPGQRE